VIPLLALTAADTFWMVGMPADLLVRGAQAAWQAPGPVFAVVVLALPAAGGLLTPALARRAAGTPAAVRRRPRPAAQVVVAVVTVALVVYGLIGSVLVARALVTATTSWPEVRADWSHTGAGVVVLAWVVSLGVATVGYRLAARAGCEACEAAGRARE
jgi:hypothetical protein